MEMATVAHFEGSILGSLKAISKDRLIQELNEAFAGVGEFVDVCR